MNPFAAIKNWLFEPTHVPIADDEIVEVIGNISEADAQYFVNELKDEGIEAEALTNTSKAFYALGDFNRDSRVMVIGKDAVRAVEIVDRARERLEATDPES